MGRIEQANGGTVFLDEIGDMPFGVQAKILRLLQERSIERLGGREPIPVNVRILAATNRNLEAALAEGKFREDLYYRLKVVTISLPPLRDREGDIPLLCDISVAVFKKDEYRQSRNQRGSASDALRLLVAGNVRELSNAIQKALIFNAAARFLTRHRKGERDSSVRPLRSGFPRGSRAGVGAASFGIEGAAAHSILPWTVLGDDEHRGPDLSGGIAPAAKNHGLSRPTLISKIEKHKLASRPPPSAKSSVTYLVLIGSGVINRHPGSGLQPRLAIKA